MKLLLVGLLLVAACSALPSMLDEWSSFKAKHGKSYSDPKEENFRIGVYLANKQMIEEHNAKYETGAVTYKLKLNHFSDMLQEEISEQMNGFNKSGLLMNNNDGLTFTRKNLRLPSQVDWREKGAVTPVKNQGSCGSCWAFSTTGSLEGQMFIKKGKKVSLSEQNLVDCSGDYGNQGCGGGLMSNAVAYIADNGGIDSEESYPYEGRESWCRFRKSNVAATAVRYANIQSGDEEALMEAVATVGPISVAINAGLSSFSYYGGGVYNDRSCNQALNHGVLLVGYGTENGQDYWLVKNSWSTNWGENGYVKIARNKGNLCGIASMAGYPVIS